MALQNTSAAINYSYYKGNWDVLPDFSKLSPDKKGLATNVNLDMRDQETLYGVLQTSFITIPVSGDYTFETASDDGSKIYISDSVLPLVNNDGIHPKKMVGGSIHMDKGSYPITVTFFQNSGENIMELYWSSNAGIRRQRIPDNAFAISGNIKKNPEGDGLKGIHNFYFSTSTGNDSRTKAEAQNPSTPWKTLQRLNDFLSEIEPGDAVLFKRGDIFDGQILISKSGTKDAAIIFSAYGSGNKAIINGFATVRDWTQLDKNIYEASLAEGNYLNLLTINNKVKAKGRYPNIAYLTVDSRTEVYGPPPTFKGPGTFTDAELPASTNNWTGAEAVIRKNEWCLDKCEITGHSGTTISYNSPSPHTPTVGFGYFIQNDIRTLDVEGEWSYDGLRHKIALYTAADSTTLTVKGSIVSSLVIANNKSNLVFDNMIFEGADTSTFNFTYDCSYITIQKCDIDFSGVDGLHAESSRYITFKNNTVTNTNNFAVNMLDCTNVLVRENKISNVGTLAGMGLSNWAG